MEEDERERTLAPEELQPFLLAMVESSDEAIFAMDSGQRIIYWSRGAEKVYGYTCDEAMGQPVSLIIPPRQKGNVDEILQRSRIGRTVADAETVRRRKDGSEVLVRLSVSSVRDHSGRTLGQSITSREVASNMGVGFEELRRVAVELERIFDSLHVLVAYLDRDFNFIRVNQAYAAADGRAPDFYPGKNLFVLFPNAENEAIFRHAVESGEPYTAIEKPFEYPEHPERGITYWDWRLEPVKDRGGRVEGLVFVLINVTGHVVARKRAEQAAEYARTLFEANPDPIVVMDLEGRISDANAATEEASGYRSPDLIGTDFKNYVNDPEWVMKGYAEVLREGRVRDYPIEIRNRDGHASSMLLNGSLFRDPDGRPAGVIAVARDVTERKLAEEERDRVYLELIELVADLRRRDAQMKHVEELLRLGYWQQDLRSGQLVWSDGAYRLFGLEPRSSAPVLEDFLQWVHPDDREAFARAPGTASADRPTFASEFRISRADNGEKRILYSEGEVQFDEEGEAANLFGALQDVTESRRVEWLMRERFRLMAENIPEVVWVSTPLNREVIYVNAAFERIWGLSRDTLYRDPSSFIDAVHPEERERVRAEVAAHRQGEWEIEYRIVRQDQTVRWIHDRRYPVLDEQGNWNLVVGIARDITDLKESEIALKKAVQELEEANRRLEQMTLEDPLTGVANRRFLERFVAREWAQEQRHGNKVSLLMVDIDNFKAYNDRYGHPRGDECLRQVARQLAEHSRRRSDIVTRFGGEEFAVFLPATDQFGAKKLAEEMRHAVELLGIPHESSTVAPVVTISIGSATVDARASGFDSLVNLADSALYRAKAGGRNRVEVALIQ